MTIDEKENIKRSLEDRDKIRDVTDAIVMPMDAVLAKLREVPDNKGYVVVFKDGSWLECGYYEAYSMAECEEDFLVSINFNEVKDFKHQDNKRK